MEENETLTPRAEGQTQDQGDAFVAGWAGEDAPEPKVTADQRATAENGAERPDEEAETGEQEPSAEGDAASEAGEDNGEGGETQPPSKEQPQQTWEVNHLGQRKTMDVQDITPELLQKGLDYDRIHQQYDRTKPVMSLVSTLAQQAGLSVEDYVRTVRTEAKMSGGMGEEEAKRAVELEDREAAVSAKEAEAQAAASAKAGDEEKIQRDIAEFAQAFPDAYEASRKDPKTIPDSVWTAVRGGLSLTAAYAQHAVAQAAQVAQEAKSQAQTAEQNRRNAQRSTGSMKSAGNDARSTDAFLAGFDD